MDPFAGLCIQGCSSGFSLFTSRAAIEQGPQTWLCVRFRRAISRVEGLLLRSTLSQPDPGLVIGSVTLAPPKEETCLKVRDNEQLKHTFFDVFFFACIQQLNQPLLHVCETLPCWIAWSFQMNQVPGKQNSRQISRSERQSIRNSWWM